ncbi:MAG: SPFH domain-containing protein [Streptomycetales bacterium]
MTSWTKPAVAAAAAAATAAVGALALLALSSKVSTNPAEMAVHYSGGPLTSTEFENCVNPSSREWDGPGDQHLKYPIGQRTYKFGPGGDTAGIKAVSSDNVQMTYTGVVTFSLDLECPTLRRFHEQIGLKDWNGQQAYINDGFEGWTAMLDVYIGQPLQRAVNTVAGRYGYRDLYNDNAARAEAEKVVERELPAYVEELAGGPFFGEFSMQLQKPSAPRRIRDALEAEQEAVAQNKAQKQRNATARTQYETFDDCKRHLAEQSCVLIHLGEQGNLVVSPGGVNVTPPG